jgi:hypothetical protein
LALASRQSGTVAAMAGSGLIEGASTGLIEVASTGIVVGVTVSISVRATGSASLSDFAVSFSVNADHGVL